MNSTLAMSAMIMLSLSLVAEAGDSIEKRIPTIRAGECTITLLDAGGIRPIEGAKLSLSLASDGSEVLAVTANKAGQCFIVANEGRYILSVNDQPLTLINASKNDGLAWARIVVSDNPMLVGGQDGSEEGKRGLAFFLLNNKTATMILAGAAVAGGGYLIYDNNRSSSDDTPPVEPEIPEQPARRPKPTPDGLSI